MTQASTTQAIMTSNDTGTMTSPNDTPNDTTTIAMTNASTTTVTGDITLSLVMATSVSDLTNVRRAVASVLHVSLNNVFVPNRRHLMSVVVVLSVRGANFQGNNLQEALVAEFERRSLPTLLGVTVTTTPSTSTYFYYTQTSRRAQAEVDYITPAIVGLVCLFVVVGAMYGVKRPTALRDTEENMLLLSSD